ncbi:apolipoprotein N-acyltransferase [Paenibacillus sinopodophylli]|uniref:apolipoprotein N-acyltransferase n=1 Tax=Paenibacillus sinopodophylli TaxID=1837342 RepID=UPI00110CA7EE|nr:nitrilase-related carbon-nitrogen hydrolase [Paenibacillus sinopodophylli]
MRFNSNVWLIAAVCLLYLVPITSNLYVLSAWLAPAILLIYMYRERVKHSVPIALACVSVVMIISNRSVIPGGLVVDSITVLISTVMLIVLLLLNKWVVTRTRHAASLLFFPMLMTSFEYFTSYGNAFGTFNSTAYSQLAIRPLAMLASVSGIWGIVFIQYLFASLLAYTLQSGCREGVRQHKRLLISTITVLLLFAGGGVVLESGQNQPETIKVSGVTPDRIIWDDTIQQLFDQWEKKGFYDQLSGQPELVEQINRINEGLFLRTEQELERGSTLISWSEGASLVLEQEEEAFLRRLQSLSAEHGAVLVAGYVRINAPEGAKMDNQVVIIDADGKIKAEYSKFSLVPGEERYFHKGEEAVPVVETAIGKIAAAICFDADFPHRIREAGLQNPDVFIIPSSDWESITPYHTEISAFRAIENQMPILRVTHAGMSAVYDAKGREVSEMNDLNSDHGIVFTAELPLSDQKHTVYKFIGDLLPLLCGAAALLILTITVAVTIISKVRKSRTT